MDALLLARATVAEPPWVEPSKSGSLLNSAVVADKTFDIGTAMLVGMAMAKMSMAQRPAGAWQDAAPPRVALVALPEASPEASREASHEASHAALREVSPLASLALQPAPLGV